MLGPDIHINPSKRPGITITLSDYGHFEGFAFVFRDAVRYRDGRMIRLLDLTGAYLDVDFSAQEVIAALLFPLPDQDLRQIEAAGAAVSRSDDAPYPPDSFRVEHYW